MGVNLINWRDLISIVGDLNGGVPIIGQGEDHAPPPIPLSFAFLFIVPRNLPPLLTYYQIPCGNTVRYHKVWAKSAGGECLSSTLYRHVSLENDFRQNEQFNKADFS